MVSNKLIYIIYFGAGSEENEGYITKPNVTLLTLTLPLISEKKIVISISSNLIIDKLQRMTLEEDHMPMSLQFLQSRII